MPGTILNKSGILVAPERRISSCVITKTAAATWASFWSSFETDVTCIFNRSSRLASARDCGREDWACPHNDGQSNNTQAMEAALQSLNRRNPAPTRLIRFVPEPTDACFLIGGIR